MANHRFTCGEKVFLTRQLFAGNRGDTIYEVMALLPSDGTVPTYHVKAAHEPFSRVALEDAMKTVVPGRPDRVTVDVPR